MNSASVMMRKYMISNLSMHVKGIACLAAVRQTMRLQGFPLQHDSCRTENRSCNYCTGVEHPANTSLNQLNYRVQPFGKINIRTQSKANVQVLPLDPQKYPLQNHIFVTISGSEPTNKHFSLEQLGDELQITGIENEKKSQNYLCTAVIPMKYDVDISVSGDKSVSVQSLENDTIDVAVQHGECHLKNIRCGNLRVQTSGGAVKCRSVLQANARITTRGTGSIHADRVQGLRFEAESECGDIALNSVYADHSTLTSRGGNVNVKNAHRHLEVHMEDTGNLTIGSLDGSVTAELADGNVDAYMARHDQVHIMTNRGDIRVNVPETVRTRAHFDASQVTMDSSLYVDGQEAGKPIHGLLCGGAGLSEDSGDHTSGAMLKLVTLNGNITLQTLDWFTSLNIGKLEDLED